MITTVSQMEPGRNADEQSVLRDAAYRAQQKTHASIERLNSIHGRPTGQQRTALKAERSKGVVAKIAFDVSFMHLVWIGEFLDVHSNIGGQYS
jgi:hypothetical protein